MYRSSRENTNMCGFSCFLRIPRILKNWMYVAYVVRFFTLAFCLREHAMVTVRAKAERECEKSTFCSGENYI